MREIVLSGKNYATVLKCTYSVLRCESLGKFISIYNYSQCLMGVNANWPHEVVKMLRAKWKWFILFTMSWKWKRNDEEAD